MNQPLLFLIILTIFAVIIIKKLIEQESEGKVTKNDEESYIQMDKAFLEKAQSGSSAIRIANIYGQFDIMFIKSLFQSEQIPYFIEFENIARLKTGLALSDYNKSILNVLEEDIDDAIKVLNEYKKNKLNNSPKGNGSLRKAAEVLVGGYIIPEASDYNIEIIYDDNTKT